MALSGRWVAYNIHRNQNRQMGIAEDTRMADCATITVGSTIVGDESLHIVTKEPLMDALDDLAWMQRAWGPIRGTDPVVWTGMTSFRLVGAQKDA